MEGSLACTPCIASHSATLLIPPRPHPVPSPPAAQVAPLWYVAQLAFNASLHLTSVTSNTILSSTSALFTFLFAVGAGGWAACGGLLPVVGCCLWWAAAW